MDKKKAGVSQVGGNKSGGKSGDATDMTNEFTEIQGAN